MPTVITIDPYWPCFTWVCFLDNAEVAYYRKALSKLPIEHIKSLFD